MGDKLKRVVLTGSKDILPEFVCESIENDKGFITFKNVQNGKIIIPEVHLNATNIIMFEVYDV
jgi:hypothetical protein